MTDSEAGRKRRRKSFTPKQRAFLEAYSHYGYIMPAAREAGVHRASVYEWRKDPAFAAAMEEAREAAVQELEEEARRRAMSQSDTLLIFLLKALRRDVYGDTYRAQVQMSGEVKHTLDPQLAEALREIYLRAKEQPQDQPGQEETP